MENLQGHDRRDGHMLPQRDGEFLWINHLDIVYHHFRVFARDISSPFVGEAYYTCTSPEDNKAKAFDA